METLHNYEPRFDGRKSFYGKAQELERENGDKILFSYWRPILKIDKNDQLFLTWYYNRSQTTRRHALDFVLNYKKNYKRGGHNTADFLKLNSCGMIDADKI